MFDATCADLPRREDCAVVRAGGGAGRQQDLPPHPPGARAQAAPLPRQAGQEVTEVGSGHCISEGKLDLWSFVFRMQKVKKTSISDAE